MFNKILIANRGEVALRIIRTCREMGIRTVAIYSKADEDCLHASMADEAYCIGPAPSQESYLNVANILSTALLAQVDAIHPGYGFLAENASFAEICEDHKIAFIGPSSKQIRAMGDKVSARETMSKNNVPVVQGSPLLETLEDAKIYAEKIGYPVMIKATAGGGGKGMRVVYSAEDLENAYNITRSEAEAFFANDKVYMEKFIANPRHIEVQILADKFGNICHLGERDCTIQRRHQKLLEEAPSEVVTKEIRAKMVEAAINAVKAINYEGIGTIEFLFDGHDFYFMEMNTRLQVEHCVTEMVTSRDLVKEQILIAAGERLSFTQEEVEIRGHAIECRINAENPNKDFMPCPGEIEGYIAPGGYGIRVDSHVYANYKIPSNYDSMIAKIICWGNNREEARRRMLRALNEYVILGVETTIPFHKKILRNRSFILNRYSTKFVEEEMMKVEV
ncbi:MAG: acetyl-CoA carboxylase biotin carboxylase subunit [Candidatus Gastranaerophilales bacterium]|nr:acetyl-CoA carboxylase biotin carboxylase subunit [Candidatus Gastranaerophilales bacterium]